MVKILFIFLLFISSSSKAENLECPFIVSHVSVEVGHEKPFPVLIPPDVDDDIDNDPQEWNYLSNKPTDIPVTVHCYPNKYSKIETDIELPLNVKKCRLENKRFWCE
jgi:hypothetical protein